MHSFLVRWPLERSADDKNKSGNFSASSEPLGESSKEAAGEKAEFFFEDKRYMATYVAKNLDSLRI